MDNVSELIRLIGKAYADEMTATLQYQMAAHIARGPGYCDAVPEYLQHMKEEFDHSNEVLKRLEQLGVSMMLDYGEIQQAGNAWTPIKTKNVKEQLVILIKAEESAIKFYKKIVEVAKEEEDWITNRLFRKLMADEEEHRVDLLRIYEGL